MLPSTQVGLLRPMPEAPLTGEKQPQPQHQGSASWGYPRHTQASHTCASRQHRQSEVRDQRSVTLFSSAAAICCKRKASCIFWAAGSSSKALMI